ncbi:sulfite exporter TauE/SafE family protein [Derxia lacustris]|uniref:sulfite exporter TauE/SafE family protein n=1 Tax=Derxia lacustris TaxID=764842 RepID=UPI0022870C3B|nr:sulfite exporter TauE/SafE family protein [Derxia lacustris]
MSFDLHFFQFVLGGAFVGFIVGMTGVGGGSLMTPLLTLVFGVPATVAVGTDLLFASVTKAGGIVTHARKGNVNWHITGWLVAGSVPAAALTLGGLHLAGLDNGALAKVMARGLGVALFLTATAIVLRNQIRALGQRFAARRQAAGGTVGSAAARDPEAVRWLPTFLLGVTIGTLVALTSVGAGALGVVALMFLYANAPARRIVGSDIAHAVPLTLVAGAGHAIMGSVNWSMLAALLVGSLPAITLGSHLTARVPEKLLRGFLATMLIVIGAKLVFA